jgi:hypothetical protein
MNGDGNKSMRRRPQGHNGLRSGTVALRMERLECRRLLAGLNVSVYLDQNHSGSFQPTVDTPAASRIVYIDLDRNGVYGNLEPLAVTDPQGNAFFGDLESGLYSIGLLTNEQYQQVIDPIAMSRPVAQPASPDLVVLEDSANSGFSSALIDIQTDRQLDFVVSLQSDNYFVGARRQGDSTELELINRLGYLEDSLLISGRPESMVLDAASQRAALATDQATSVVAVVQGRLQIQAALAEAIAPIAFHQNRLVSADRADPGRLIIWNADEWSPIQREKISTDAIMDIALSSSGDTITALTPGWIHTAHWMGTHASVLIGSAADEIRLRMGVRINQAAPAIQVESAGVRQIVENGTDQLELASWIVGSDERNYWFTITESPQNGRVALNPSGAVLYTPNTGFSGRDQVVFKVLDGITESLLTIEWLVQESNKPPTAMVVDVPAFAENTPVGSQLGFVTVIDPNAGASYRVTTSDSRFRVENGRLYLDAELDFESEPRINLEFLALDAQQQFSITTAVTLNLLNVLEPPKSISLTNSTVLEKAENVVVGRIVLSDPDPDADYVISVSDSRFVVEGDQLILRQRLLHRDSPLISLNLTAADRNSPDISRTDSLTLTVQVVSDAPRDIVISSDRVPEATPGGVVGRLSAIGLSDGDEAQFSVSDSRFEVVDGVLKLRSDVEVQRSTESSIALSVTATTAGGALTVVFPLVVVAPRSPWQNPVTPPDVNNDGRVSAIDVLQIINHLNQHGSGVVPPPPPQPDGNGESTPFYPDVNGDGRVSALDALLIINILNARANLESPVGGEGEASAEGEDDSPNPWKSDLQGSAASWHAWEEENSQRRKNLQIDIELEALLEQLANDKR